jgi:hypothetical protein
MAAPDYELSCDISATSTLKIFSFPILASGLYQMLPGGVLWQFSKDGRIIVSCLQARKF